MFGARRLLVCLVSDFAVIVAFRTMASTPEWTSPFSGPNGRVGGLRLSGGCFGHRLSRNFADDEFRACGRHSPAASALRERNNCDNGKGTWPDITGWGAHHIVR